MGSQYDLTFTSKDDGKIFTRKLYGLEGMIATMAQKADGFGAFDGAGVIEFPKPVPKENLERAVEASWTRLRKTVPIIALKTYALPAPDNDFHYLEYVVPSNDDDVKEWTQKTLIWHDDAISMHDRDQQLKNSYWKPGEGHYNYELHVAPDIEDGKWQFIVHAGHWSIDARGFMQTFGIFLAHLNEYLVEEKPFSNSGAWGEETKYFAPASVVVGAEAAGQPLSSLFPEPQPTKAPDTSAAASAPAPVMFLRPINLLDPEPKNSQQSYDIWLSETQTSAFREACRQRNLTVTQATTALMSLAELEWVMSFPMGETEEQKKAAIKGFKEATHVPSIWNIVDQRLKMGEYSSHEGEKGSPTMAADGFPLMMDMHVLRKAIKYDEATGQITRNPRDDVFWDSVVPMCRDAWKVNDMSWQGFLQREIGSQQMIPLFVGEAYMIPSLLSSSIGDAELCGFLTHVSPLIRRQREAKGEILDKHLVMDQLSFSVRTPTPLKMILVWQWNGRMMLRLHSSAKWTSEEGMKKFGQIFSEWIDMVA